MPTFNEANQARLSLKMKLCRYAWYHSSLVHTVNDGFGVSISVKYIDNNIRKLIPPLINNVEIKTDLL